jgi:hypothetical protein
LNAQINPPQKSSLKVYLTHRQQCVISSFVQDMDIACGSLARSSFLRDQFVRESPQDVDLQIESQAVRPSRGMNNRSEAGLSEAELS